MGVICNICKGEFVGAGPGADWLHDTRHCAATTPAKLHARIAELEAENAKLARVIYDEAHRAATLGSGSTGWLRGRFMSISNALNAAIGRTQSSHGDQYDGAGSIVKSDPHTNS